jgi:uncharacterized protein YkwD
VQNKNKKLQHLSAKLLVNFLIIVFMLKVLVVGTLFLIPKYTASAQSNSINPEKLILLTNQEREKQGLPALIPNKLLQVAAQRKAADIIKNDYFAHTSPKDKLFYEWIQEVNYNYRSAGENLAISFVKNTDIMRAWMNSRTHRENILDTRYREIGMAALTGDFNGEETTIVVQMFGQPIKGLSSKSGNITKLALGASANNLIATPNFNQPLGWLYQINWFLNISLMILIPLLGLVLIQRAWHKGTASHLWRYVYAHYLQNRGPNIS